MVWTVVVGAVVVVGGMDVDDVGGSIGGSVVVVTAGDVVFTGGEAVGVVPTVRDRVVATGGEVVANPPEDGAVVVGVVESTVDEVVVDDEVEVLGTVTLVTTARVVVVDCDRVASSRLGDVSLPVKTSKSRATRASEASA